MNGLADRVVAAETKADIADATASLHARTFFLDSCNCVHEINGVVVVFLHPRRDRQNIGVKDDVFGREIQFFG